MSRLSGKVACVAGAASGIGKATALLFAAEGARVVATDINAAGAELVAKDCGGWALAHDVGEEGDWTRVVAEIERREGRLQVLAITAGIEHHTPLLATSIEDFRRVQRVNVEGTFLGIKAAAPAMRRAGGGAIVTISSVAGLNGAANLSAYCASKGAVRLLTKAAAVEFAQSGWPVRVNSVHPGFIDTPMARTMFRNLDPDQAKQLEAHIARLHPMNRWGRAEEVARTILYLASDDSSFVTGAEHIVDGGYSAR
ncbi:MAG: SDR family oxidoreductase [Alphaproteobacteria bacterium]|nr:SDR family oxidoreductase [Alphaproteobacteria bacterium]